MGIKEDLQEIKDLMKKQEEVVKEKKEKGFRYPLGKKVGKGQKKKNYVTVLKINENNTATFKKVKIEDQTFMEDGVPRLASSCYFFH